MLFNFPKKRINDTSWFVSSNQSLVFGIVKLITIAISEDTCKTYYRLVDSTDAEHTIVEDQLLDTDVIVPSPKYAVGDGVVYTSLIKDGTSEQKVDIIRCVEISFYEKHFAEISYIMENDEDENWVLEDEILSHGGQVIDVTSKPIETVEDEYSIYDHLGMDHG